VLPETLPAHVRELAGAARAADFSAAGGPPTLPELEAGFDLEARGEEFYRHYLALALARAGGVQVKAAEMLGMSFRSFRYYAKKYGLRGGTDDEGK
jgi:two-component system response regulator PilR (NtrC family)